MRPGAELQRVRRVAPGLRSGPHARDSPLPGRPISLKVSTLTWQPADRRSRLGAMVAAVFGRESELGAVDALLGSGRNGFAALVLEGDPGIGKTTVWRRGIARAEDLGHRVLSCRAAQAEARLSFTALGDLLAPIEAAAFRALPDPQRRALDAARSCAQGSTAPHPARGRSGPAWCRSSADSPRAAPS